MNTRAACAAGAASAAQESESRRRVREKEKETRCEIVVQAQGAKKDKQREYQSHISTSSRARPGEGASIIGRGYIRSEDPLREQHSPQSSKTVRIYVTRFAIDATATTVFVDVQGPEQLQVST